MFSKESEGQRGAGPGTRRKASKRQRRPGRKGGQKQREEAGQEGAEGKTERRAAKTRQRRRGERGQEKAETRGRTGRATEERVEKGRKRAKDSGTVAERHAAQGQTRMYGDSTLQLRNSGRTSRVTPQTDA